MKNKIIIIIVILLHCCANISAQQCGNFEWKDIESKRIYGDNVSKHKKTIVRHLQKHTKKFKHEWEKFDYRLGKNTLNRIIENMELFYIPNYKIVDTIENEVKIKLSKHCISNIIFVYNGYCVGNFFNGRCKTMTPIKHQNTYWHKFNYGVNIFHYSRNIVDMDFLLDFLVKGYDVFSLENVSDGDTKSIDLWFSTNQYVQLIKFDRVEIWNKIEKYDKESNFKSQFYKK